MGSYIRNTIKHIIGSIIAIYVSQMLRREASKLSSIEELVDFAFNFHERLWLPIPSKFKGAYRIVAYRIGIRPIQVREEIIELLRIVSELKPKALIEIGTAAGGTLFLFSRVASPDALIVSIDLPGGKFGGGYPEWKIPIYRSFAKDDQKIVLLRADSHDPKTLEEVRRILGNRKLDFLFIDGDHSYEGVRKDFEMYSPLVREGGIIAFHDIVEHPPETGCEVSKFWNEIKHRYKYAEIVKDWNQKWAGIGVLYV